MGSSDEVRLVPEESMNWKQDMKTSWYFDNEKQIAELEKKIEASRTNPKRRKGKEVLLLRRPLLTPKQQEKKKETKGGWEWSFKNRGSTSSHWFSQQTERRRSKNQSEGEVSVNRNTCPGNDDGQMSRDYQTQKRRINPLWEKPSPQSVI
jgi:hypothetical protein